MPQSSNSKTTTETKTDELDQSVTKKTTTTKTETIGQATTIPHDTVRQKDPNLDPGTTKVVQEGKDGSRADKTTTTTTDTEYDVSITVHVQDKHETITTGEGTTEEVSRDIYTQLDDKLATLHDTQRITLHRTGDKNLTTGKITWDAWKADAMPAYSAPSIPNYTVKNPDAGASVSVDGSQTKLADLVFNYDRIKDN